VDLVVGYQDVLALVVVYLFYELEVRLRQTYALISFVEVAVELGVPVVLVFVAALGALETLVRQFVPLARPPRPWN